MARRSSRRGTTRADRSQRTSGGPAQLPWRQLRNPLPPIELLRPDQIEAIHDTSLRILEEVGMDFLHPDALELLRQAGSDPLVATWAEEHHRPAHRWTVPSSIGDLLKACDDD